MCERVCMSESDIAHDGYLVIIYCRETIADVQSEIRRTLFGTYLTSVENAIRMRQCVLRRSRRQTGDETDIADKNEETAIVIIVRFPSHRSIRFHFFFHFR